MPSKPAHKRPRVRVRAAKPRDLDALIALENRVFASDRLSRRSLRHFLQSPTAAMLVAEGKAGSLAGNAIVLFRPRSMVARLYSIAVAPNMSGRGVAPMLLTAVERIARRRGCDMIRLEVHQANKPAIARYRKQGYEEFGRYRRYYQNGGDALRFQKRLGRSRGVSRR
jgi:ribosomal protein S18 acetylase RimI-like enzyme